jgi:hypothetical protein
MASIPFSSFKPIDYWAAAGCACSRNMEYFSYTIY